MEKRDWRASVVIPEELADRVYAMRQNEEFARCSISEILRVLLMKGLDAFGYGENDRGNRPA